MRPSRDLYVLLVLVAMTWPAGAGAQSEGADPPPEAAEVTAADALPREEEPAWPWHRLEVSAGFLISTAESTVTLGASRLGLAVDPEELLGLERRTLSARVAAAYRLGRKPRHRLSASWAFYHRSATTTLDQEFVLRDVTFTPDLTADTDFDLDLVRFGYDWAFVHDYRMDLGVGLSVYLMPTRFDLRATRADASIARTEESFTAPIPTLSLRGGFLISPKWFLLMNLNYLYFDISGVALQFTDLAAAVEWRFTEPLAVGLAYSEFAVQVDATRDTDYPAIDFLGGLGLRHTGLNVYLALRAW